MRLTYQRSSTAYLPDVGQRMRTGLPRYQEGLFVGTRALLMEEGTTNLLTENQSNVETDTTGFTAVNGATLLRTTAVAFEGVAALGVVTGVSAAAGVGVSLTTSTQGNYVGRCRVRSPSSSNVEVFLRITYTDASLDESAHVVVPQSFFFEDIVTAGVPTNGAKTVNAVILYVRRMTGTADVTYYVDASQIEARAHATSWHIGGGTRAAEFATLPAYELINNEETTIEGWLKLLSALGASRYLFDARQRPEQSVDTNRWSLRVTNTGTLTFGYWTGLAFASISSSTPLSLNTWTHFAVKWSRAGAVLYLNGAPVISTSNAPVFLRPFPVLHVGSTATLSLQLNGVLSSVRFTRRARSDGEILAAYSNVNTFEPGLFFDSLDTRPESRVFSFDGTLSSRPGSQNLYVPESDFVLPTVVTASTTATNFTAANVVDFEFPLLPHRTTTLSQSTFTFDFGDGVNIVAMWMGLINYLGAYVEYSWNNVTFTAPSQNGILCPQDADGDGYRKGWQPLSFSARYVKLTVPTQMVDTKVTYFETPLVIFAAETTGLHANRQWGTQFSVQYDAEESQAGGHDEVQARGERYVQLQVRGMAHRGESSDWLDLIRLGPHRKFLWLNNLSKPEQSWLFRLAGQASWEEQWNPIVSLTFKEHIN